MVLRGATMKKKGILIGTILLVIIATIVTCFMMSGRNTLESHLKLAVKYFNEGNYEEAILEFDKAIKIDDKIFHIYLAKANAEIEIGNNDAALESTIKMVELLKVNDEIANKTMLQAHTILLDMYNTSKYKEKEDLLIWFYETAYGNEKYVEYLSWIEDYLPDEYDVSMEWIREDYEEAKAEYYVSLYDDILLKYKKAAAANYEYDHVNGETFDKKYPGVNFEVAAGMETDLYYSIIDINGDEIPEMFIGGDGNNIYDIYGIKDGRPERLFDVYSMGNRIHYTVYEDGIIGYRSSGGISNGGYKFYKVHKSSEIKENGMTSEIEYLKWEDDRYFITRKNGDSNTELSEEEFDAEVEKYVEIGYKNMKWQILKYYQSDNEEVSENVSSNNSKLTEQEAVKLVLKKIGSEMKDEYKLIPDNEDAEQFTFKLCEDSPEKQTVINWYYVNKKTKEVTSMF